MDPVGKEKSYHLQKSELSFFGFCFPNFEENYLANAEIWDPMKHSTGNVESYPKHSMGLEYLPA